MERAIPGFIIFRSRLHHYRDLNHKDLVEEHELDPEYNLDHYRYHLHNRNQQHLLEYKHLDKQDYSH